MWKNWISHTLVAEYKMILSLWRTVGQFLTKLDVLLHGAAVLLTVYPKGSKIYVSTKSCTQILIDAVFTLPTLRSNKEVLL